MPFSERMKHESFVYNQYEIEERWSTDFGDRMNELVFIGINLDEVEIRKQLNDCLCNNEEIKDYKKGIFPQQDLFPILKQVALKQN